MFDGMTGPLKDEQKEYLDNILQSGRHLLSMISDILELSRLDIGEIEITPKEFNLREMLEGSLEIFKVKALKQSIKTALDVESGIETIIADERVIKQVVSHLLSNAFKFTPDGGSISVQARRVHKRDVVARSPDSRDDEAISKNEIATPEPALSDNARLLRFARNDKSEGARNDSLGDFIEIIVEDTGIGISEEDQKRLFTPFEQLEPVYTKRYGGTGLGLYFSRRLVELHGGRILVESRVGKGSKFTFIIPSKK
jgi:signal transduction histidine kinase